MISLSCSTNYLPFPSISERYLAQFKLECIIYFANVLVSWSRTLIYNALLNRVILWASSECMTTADSHLLQRLSSYNSDTTLWVSQHAQASTTTPQWPLHYVRSVSCFSPERILFLCYQSERWSNHRSLPVFANLCRLTAHNVRT